MSFAALIYTTAFCPDGRGELCDAEPLARRCRTTFRTLTTQLVVRERTSMASEYADREECVFLAKLAEQAERYDEMVEEVRKIAKMVHDQELSVEERNLLSVAYKNVIGSRRASWRIVSSIEQKEENKGNVDHVERIKKYRRQVCELAWAIPLCEGLEGISSSVVWPLRTKRPWCPLQRLDHSIFVRIEASLTGSMESVLDERAVWRGVSERLPDRQSHFRWYPTDGSSLTALYSSIGGFVYMGWLCAAQDDALTT